MEQPDDVKIFMLHHHLLPIPGTGRERNIVNDAGDVLEVLVDCGVDLVLSGHKHVPYAWRLENMYVVNAGTVATLRLRGDTKPCYNVVEVRGDHMTVSRRYPFHGGETIVSARPSTADERPGLDEAAAVALPMVSTIPGGRGAQGADRFDGPVFLEIREDRPRRFNAQWAPGHLREDGRLRGDRAVWPQSLTSAMSRC
jgi:3',5'-cyclic AMP phosphodiesterase CpdA